MAQLLPFSMRLQHGVSLVVPQFSSLRSIRVQVALYTAVATASITFFFFLHHLGNQIPFDLAKERYFEQSDYRVKMLDGEVEYIPGILNVATEYCQIWSLILSGARRDEGDNAFEDAVILKGAGWGSGCNSRINSIIYPSHEDGTYRNKRIGEMRYWWGNKALYAIASQYLTFYEVHQLIRVSTYGAYLLLAVSLALMGWRAFLTGLPILLFGIFLGSIWAFADVHNAPPQLWSLVSTSVLALMFWRGASPQVLRLFCFITGMVSCYLWHFDGTLLSIPLIALVCWLGSRHLKPSDRVRKSLICVVLYILGFAVCFGLGQATKAVVYELMISDGHNYFGGYVASNLLGGTGGNLGRLEEKVSALFTGRDYLGCIVCGDSDWRNWIVPKQLIEFWHMIHMSAAGERALGIFSAFALLVATAIAIFNAMRGNKEAAWSIIFMLGLMVVVCLQYVLPNSNASRIVRFVFLLPALCWSSLALALIYSNQRTVTVVAGGFAVVMSSVLIWWGINASHLATLTRGAEIVIRSDFDVYVTEDRLIYIKDDCDASDVESRFFLHVDPVDANDLPDARRGYSFDNLSFHFYERKLPLMSATRLPLLTRCAATVDLPEYDISLIRTGQLRDEVLLWMDWRSVYRGSGNDQSTDDGYEFLWAGTFSPGAVNGFKVLQEVRQSSQRPDIESDFDVHLYDNSLIYLKSPCSDDDRDARLFLHLIPADLDDLPDARRGYNFDNRDFTFMEHGLVADDECVAVVDLPKYHISHIRTGQLDENDERIWAGMFNAPAARALNSSQEIQQSGHEPDIESDFDVYLYENKLVYTKSTCSDNDRDARLFLHLIPADLNDLPDARQGYSFDNLDFTLIEHGLMTDGECVAVVRLPEYSISEIRTGQLDKNGEKIWEGEIVANTSSWW